jgi:hypothetical protein
VRRRRPNRIDIRATYRRIEYHTAGIRRRICGPAADPISSVNRDPDRAILSAAPRRVRHSPPDQRAPSPSLREREGMARRQPPCRRRHATEIGFRRMGNESTMVARHAEILFAINEAERCIARLQACAAACGSAMASAAAAAVAPASRITSSSLAPAGRRSPCKLRSRPRASAAAIRPARRRCWARHPAAGCPSPAH